MYTPSVPDLKEDVLMFAHLGWYWQAVTCNLF